MIILYSLLMIYFFCGVSNLVGKWLSSGVYWHVTYKNWYKSMLLWPIEIKRAMNMEDVF